MIKKLSFICLEVRTLNKTGGITQVLFFSKQNCFCKEASIQTVLIDIINVEEYYIYHLYIITRLKVVMYVWVCVRICCQEFIHELPDPWIDRHRGQERAGLIDKSGFLVIYICHIQMHSPYLEI